MSEPKTDLTADATDSPTIEEQSVLPVPTDVETKDVTDEVPEATELTDSDAVEEPSADDQPVVEEPAADSQPKAARPGINWGRVLAYGILPGFALILALAAGFLKYQDSSVRDADTARAQSIQVAKDSTIKLLSYRPDTVAKDLTAARDLLTGEFRDSYTQLTNDVVIPGSQQKQISAVASVPKVASVSANPNEAVVLVFVNQTVIVGNDAPTATASSVQVTLDRVGDRWLISKFDPI